MIGNGNAGYTSIAVEALGSRMVGKNAAGGYPRIVQEVPLPRAARTASSVGSTSDMAILPQGTPVVVSPLQDVRVEHIGQHDAVAFAVEVAVVARGVVVIPRGSTVQAFVVRQGCSTGARGGKYRLGFASVRVRGRDCALRGSHVEEGRGAAAGFLLGLFPIVRRSALIAPGQLVNAFTAEPICYEA